MPDPEPMIVSGSESRLAKNLVAKLWLTAQASHRETPWTKVETEHGLSIVTMQPLLVLPVQEGMPHFI